MLWNIKNGKKRKIEDTIEEEDFQGQEINKKEKMQGKKGRRR